MGLLDEIEEDIPVVTKSRTADRHKRDESGKRISVQKRYRKSDDVLTRRVLFLDGEGVNVGEPVDFPNKKQRRGQGSGRVLKSEYQRQDYVVINCHGSDGTTYRLANKDYSRLTTEQCLKWLIQLHRFGQKQFIVGFGLNYDFSQILKDLPLDRLQWMKESEYKSVLWKRWRITLLPKRCLTITERTGKKRTVRIWDTLTFFQSSFVSAAEKCGLLSDAGKNELLRYMKSEREHFDKHTMDKVEEYNELECDLGLEMFSKIRHHWTDLGLKLMQFHGAGAVAAAMLRQNNIKEYMQRDSSGMQLPEHVMGGAYYGGRFDYSRQGLIGTVHEYDINSAYPFQASRLPCLSHAKWIRRDGYHPVSQGVYGVRWNHSGAWAPFPYRTSKHSIHYLDSGAGYYYRNEMESARAFADLDIFETWELVVECDHVPFHWIPEYYAQRQELKERGDYGERLIKLGLNALYGKLAQQDGYGGHLPAYQNYIWAGMITSNTRAMLLDAAAQEPMAITHMATDGIYSTRPLQLDCHPTRLGAWEHKVLEDMILVCNGIYQSRDDGRLIAKTRGWNWQALPFEKLREQFAAGDFETPVVLHSKEFIGINSISSEVEYPRRCMWKSTQSKMRVTPPVWKEVVEQPWQYSDGTWETMRLLLPGRNPSRELSMPGTDSTSSSSNIDNYFNDYEEWDGQY